MRRAAANSIRRAVTRLPLTPLAAATLLQFSAAAHAATITVNDTGAGSVAGKCTLLDAVAALNTAAPVNACSAGDGSNDTILLSFPTATPRAITFALPGSADAKSALQIDRAVTLVGPLDSQGTPLVQLRRSSVSGTPSFRILAATADTVVQGLSIAYGETSDQGGGVFASGAANLTLRHTRVTNNTSLASSGGGVAAECGNILLQHATIAANSAYNGGGGVYTSNSSGGSACSSTITLQDAIVSGNSTAHGTSGGIYSFNGAVVGDRSSIDGNASTTSAIGGIGAYGSITLTNSTVSNNSAALTWGGLSSATITLLNTTVSGNHSGARGGAFGGKNLTLYLCTVTDNISDAADGSAVFFDTHAQIVGDIVHGNTPFDFFSSHAATVSGGYNIIASSSATYQAPLPPDTLDCDPQLGPLANNGGPTLTMLPGLGSCAIDAGPPAVPPTVASDQRGELFERIYGSASDVGAVEIQPNDRVFYDGFGI